jgi:hypothetical protein
MPIQCRTYLLSSHMHLQRHQPSIPLLTQDTSTAVTLPDHVDIVIRNDRWRLDLAAREPKHYRSGKAACQVSAEAVVYGRRNSIDVADSPLRTYMPSPPNAARKGVRNDAGVFLGSANGRFAESWLWEWTPVIHRETKTWADHQAPAA